MRNNEDREQEANSEDVGNVRQTNDDDATHDGRPKAAPKPCHEIMNNTLHVPSPRPPPSNTRLLKTLP